MNWRIVRAIALKDLKEVRQNGMAWKPMLILPLVFCVLLPLLLIIGPTVFNLPLENMMADPDLAMMLNSLPATVQTEIADLNDHQILMMLTLGFLLAPLFLMLPIMTASIIGSESFVGEKERRTIEPLLYTPATERELFAGKMLAAVIPAVLVAWGSFVVYALILNVAGGAVMGRIWFPLPAWWPLVLWLSPAVAVLGMVAAVMISARASTFMEAYQMTGLLVLPVLLLVIGQITGVIYLSAGLVLLVGLAVWLLDAGLLALVLRRFSRTGLMQRG